MENEQNSRGFFGVIIPIKLLDSKELTPGEKIVYAYIASYRKACFDDNERISERTGISLPTVKRALTNLTKLGFVFIEKINGSNHKRRLYAVMDDPKKLKYLVQKGLLNGEASESFPQGFPPLAQNEPKENPLAQNEPVLAQNEPMANRGSLAQIEPQRIEENKNKAPGAISPAEKPRAGRTGASIPKRKNYKTEDEYVKALYKWRST